MFSRFTLNAENTTPVTLIEDPGPRRRDRFRGPRRREFSDSEALNPGASSETCAAWATGLTAELTAELPPQPLSASPVTATVKATIAEAGNHLPLIGRNSTARRRSAEWQPADQRVETLFVGW